MNCPDQETLSAFFDGEAPEAGEHVATCGACRAFVDDLTAIRSTIVAARPELRSAISLRQRRLRRPKLAFALLMLVLLLVPALFLLRHRERPDGAFGNYDGGGRAVIYVKGRE